MVNKDDCVLTRYPAPVLTQPAKPIENIDDNIRNIADKMIDMMLENHGVGLDGTQAGVPLRIFVASLDGTKENAKVYINPKITPSGPLESQKEGCLSVTGVYATIRRYKNCSVTATGLNGKEFTEHAEGLLARAFQHECDHLDGMLIIDRIGRVAKMAIRGRLKELQQDYQQQEKS